MSETETETYHATISDGVITYARLNRIGGTPTGSKPNFLERTPNGNPGLMKDIIARHFIQVPTLKEIIIVRHGDKSGRFTIYVAESEVEAIKNVVPEIWPLIVTVEVLATES